MKISRVFRRPLQLASAALMLAFTALPFSPVADVQAQAKPLKKAKIAVGTTVINVG